VHNIIYKKKVCFINSCAEVDKIVLVEEGHEEVLAWIRVGEEQHSWVEEEVG
jgi:hypothetical protein